METQELTEKAYTWLDKSKLFFKAVIIFIMAMALWIPSHFVMELIKERKGRQAEAVADISNKWAKRQTITGPLLLVPYQTYSKDDKGNTVAVKQKIYFMPDRSDVQAQISPEKRYRGIYQVIVYRSEISITGKFNP